MLELLLQRRPRMSTAGLILAMDYEGGFTDLVTPTRVFGNTGPNVSISTAQKMNGASSYQHIQPYADSSYALRTSRTEDLTFAGDFWVEMWGFCQGQGYPVWTGGYNWMFSYGKYASTGVQGLALLDLKPTFSVVSGGTGTATLLQSPIAAVNNAWQHFALGRKNGKLYLFLNGKMVASADYNGIFGYDEFLSIGGYHDARLSGGCYSGFNGYIDRLRVYGQCLTTEDFTPSAAPF